MGTGLSVDEGSISYRFLFRSVARGSFVKTRAIAFITVIPSKHDGRRAQRHVRGQIDDVVQR
jgi:hypothetical protein